MRRKILGCCFTAISLIISTHVFATAYTLPKPNDSLIGQRQYNATQLGDSVYTIAQKYDLGFNALESANPQLDLGRKFPDNALIQLPTEHLLPDEDREGVIVNLPEMRMYYFKPETNQVFTYPIGVGKIGKLIPIVKTSVTYKKENPTWTPPQDIRDYDLKELGIVLPKKVPAGPDNPLGRYAVYMKLETYLMHSTIYPESIGTRASFGCIRMYQSDIETLFPEMKRGTPVLIINSPIKLGWQEDKLYMEQYKPLEEHDKAFEAKLPGAVHMITELTKDEPTLVDWQLVAYLAAEKDGIPHAIGMKIPQ